MQKLSCGHEKNPFGAPLCAHLRTCREPWLKYVKWFIGSGVVCVACAEEREKGISTEAAFVCEECFQYATTGVGDPVRTGGRPEIRALSEPFDDVVCETPIPNDCKKIIDIAPIKHDSRSTWLLLVEDVGRWRFDAQNEASELVARAKVPSEVAGDWFAGHTLTTRLHASQDGDFAAVLNDYGRHGQVIDLRSGKTTLRLDGGDYHPETVPFSFTFAIWQGQSVVIHRTAWNRLDISDASTGGLLSDRDPTSYRSGEQRRQHYLDYFHGALYLSPDGAHILDDGWYGIRWAYRSFGVWTVGSRNTFGNPRMARQREKYALEATIGTMESHGWTKEQSPSVESEMTILRWSMVHVFLILRRPVPLALSGVLTGRGHVKFAGPAGKFFSDSKYLYSTGKDGLSRWDPKAGVRTGHIENFFPSRHHAGAGELIQLSDSALLRWGTTEKHSYVPSWVIR